MWNSLRLTKQATLVIFLIIVPHSGTPNICFLLFAILFNYKRPRQILKNVIQRPQKNRHRQTHPDNNTGESHGLRPRWPVNFSKLRTSFFGKCPDFVHEGMILIYKSYANQRICEF